MRGENRVADIGKHLTFVQANDGKARKNGTKVALITLRYLNST